MVEAVRQVNGKSTTIFPNKSTMVKNIINIFRDIKLENVIQYKCGASF